MKKLLLLLAAVGMIFTACQGGLDNEENGGTPSTPKIELSQQSVEVEFESAEYEVSITSTYSWEATAKNDWIKVITETGIAGTKELKFSVERNEELEIREGTIVVKNEDYNIIAELYITQKASVHAITIEPESLAFAVEGGTQEITITANFEYTYTANVDWITFNKISNGISVTVPNNEKAEERIAEITISSKEYDFSKKISVSQTGLLNEKTILYTSSDGEEVTLYETTGFGANIVSNTYENGQGIIIFDAPVTSIGAYAFRDCRSLTSVTIPDSVTSIGISAFYYCDSLTSVTIPDSITSIGGSAFEYCRSLTSITIPDSVTSINYATFCGCSSLISITIPDSVTSIGDYAFNYCSSLTSVTIPDSVTSIGGYTFSGCSSLTSVTIGNSVTKIGKYTFSGCSSLTGIAIPVSVTSIGEDAFEDCSSLIGITIPDSVTSIGAYAFRYCSSLTSVAIGNGVTEIGYFAFEDCSSLTSVTIGNSITSIGSYAFDNCSRLTRVDITDLLAWCKIDFGGSSANPLANKAKLYLNNTEVSELIIPSNITEIKSYAFIGCSSLKSATIPDSVTSIGDRAFAYCSSLTRVDITDLSTWCKIDFYNVYANPLCNGAKLYLNNSEVTELIIPSDVTEIKQYTFSGCSSLTSVTIPDSVTSIGRYAFYSCSSLTNVYCKPTYPPTTIAEYHVWGAFDSNASGRKIYVPRNSVSAYKAKQYWSDYASDIEGYDF